MSSTLKEFSGGVKKYVGSTGCKMQVPKRSHKNLWLSSLNLLDVNDDSLMGTTTIPEVSGLESKAMHIKSHPSNNPKLDMNTKEGNTMFPDIM